MSEPERELRHVAGHVVSRSTYERHGCRCAGCTADKHSAMRRYRQNTYHRSPRRKVREDVLLDLARGATVLATMQRYDVPYSYIKAVLDRLVK